MTRTVTPDARVGEEISTDGAARGTEAAREGEQFSGPLPPERFNMARYCLEAAVRDHPDKLALVVLGGEPGTAVSERWTFRELDIAVRRLAGGLTEAGVCRGMRIALMLGNRSSFALTFFALLSCGAVAVPLSDQLSAQEIRRYLAEASVEGACYANDVFMPAERPRLTLDEATIRQHALHGPLRAPQDTHRDDPAFLIFTSGTGGRAKPVLHAHRSAWGRRPMYADWYGISAADRVLHAGAFNWTYTLGTGLTDPWANGATAIVSTRPRSGAEWPALIRESDATLFAAVPGVYRQILERAPEGPIAVGALRHALSAGEKMPDGIAHAWQARTGTRIYEAFGMSEISTFISASPARAAVAGSIGRAQTGRAIAVLDPETGFRVATGEVGRLAVHRSDPGLMLEPDRAGSATSDDAWFITGDLVAVDADGNVTHHGRADDLITAGGYRISPLEVERALGGCPGVEELAVAAVMLRDGLAILVAFVVAAESAAPRQALHAFAASTLAG
ncbi:MAG: class I adenylate-forming enzyme family protein, partial [Pseudomonadota bacterium]